ncbi:unnamed protein product [Camellia sinensis]
MFSFLVSCQDQLVLAGLCNGPRGPAFNWWKIDEKTMEFSEIAIMPQDLLYCLFDSDGFVTFCFFYLIKENAFDCIVLWAR